MSERAQMIHMLVRVSRLAAERWGMQLSQAAGLLGSSGALGYIARNFGLFHMEGDEAVREKIAAVAEAAGSIRQIKLSHGNIDAGVLDDGTRAFVGFANYNVSEVKGFVATFKLKKRYENVKTLDGAPVKVEWDSTTARCEFDLGDSQALLFSWQGE